jgi:hypothetical protein
VVSFTPQPLYDREKSPRYPLDRRLGGPQSRSGLRGEEKILDPTGTRTPTPRSSSPKPVAIPTALFWLQIGVYRLYKSIKLLTLNSMYAGCAVLLEVIKIVSKAIRMKNVRLESQRLGQNRRRKFSRPTYIEIVNSLRQDILCRPAFCM